MVCKVVVTEGYLLITAEPQYRHIYTRKEAIERLDQLYNYCKELLSMPENILNSDVVKYFFMPVMADIIQQRKCTGLAISAPIASEEFKVKTDYESKDANEISLKAGEIVTILEKTETGWWKVISDNGRGWVPRSYLLPLQNDYQKLDLDGDCCAYVAANVYKAQQNDELDLEEGVAMMVLEKNDTGWWKVRCKNGEGIVPRVCINPLDSPDGKKHFNPELTNSEKSDKSKPKTVAVCENKCCMTTTSPRRMSKSKPAPLPPLPTQDSGSNSMKVSLIGEPKSENKPASSNSP
ncbi:hypothetical protein LSH36_8g09046 [Paralvinella palmiformis]|uniref:SH3 domain-containing protein n=1 Tax=Paralvinella palmiformis TaxID=53620 RepID=A0AAD9KE38_9ANNE|nr:hypothetical protein LSH36_8g09046 [Paralvinella palmiformis]